MAQSTHMARNNKHLHRVAIFLKKQNPAVDAAPHTASRALASTLENLQLLRFLNKDRSAAQLRTKESWRELKSRVRGTESGKVIVKLLPPLDYYGCALAAYPPTPRNQRERFAQEERWMNATRF